MARFGELRRRRRVFGPPFRRPVKADLDEETVERPPALRVNRSRIPAQSARWCCRSRPGALAILPAILLLVAVLATHGRWLLALFGLGATILSIPRLLDPLPTGGTLVYWQDIVVVLALGAWALGRLTRQERDPLPLPRSFLPPLAVLTVGLLAGEIQGHIRYGSSLIGQPLRPLIYVGVGAALVGLPVEKLYRGVMVLFYGGAVIEAILGAYYLALGRSQTHALALSTGGTRALALGTALYLSGALIFALLNLELDERPSRRLLHLTMGALALFGIVVAFGRTNYVALAVILPVILVALKRVRHAFGAMLPLLLPGIAVVAVIISLTFPKFWSSVWERVGGTSGNDINVVFRERASAATIAGLSKSPLLGLGFGRPVTFQLPSTDPIPVPVYQTIAVDPHNSYAYVLAGGGFVALTGLLSLFAVFTVDAIRRARRTTGRGRVLVLWALGFWFVFVVNAVAGPVIDRSDFVLTMWLLMLLPAAIVPTLGKREPRSTTTATPRH
jgi:O-antigen ligase